MTGLEIQSKVYKEIWQQQIEIGKMFRAFKMSLKMNI